MLTIKTSHIKEIKGKNEDVTIINVLSREDYQKEHIPGSINIPIEDPESFVQRVESTVPSKSHKIIVYCASPSCNASDQAAEKLEQASFTNVLRFEGGMKEWKEAGERVESS